MVRTLAGEVLQSARSLQEAQMPKVDPRAAGWSGRLRAVWSGIVNIFAEPPEEEGAIAPQGAQGVAAASTAAPSGKLASSASSGALQARQEAPKAGPPSGP